jgi:hypothetical protein
MENVPKIIVFHDNDEYDIKIICDCIHEVTVLEKNPHYDENCPTIDFDSSPLEGSWQLISTSEILPPDDYFNDIEKHIKTTQKDFINNTIKEKINNLTDEITDKKEEVSQLKLKLAEIDQN